MIIKSIFFIKIKIIWKIPTLFKFIMLSTAKENS